jgi:hypothetical protein
VTFVDGIASEIRPKRRCATAAKSPPGESCLSSSPFRRRRRDVDRPEVLRGVPLLNLTEDENAFVMAVRQLVEKSLKRASDNDIHEAELPSRSLHDAYGEFVHKPPVLDDPRTAAARTSGAGDRSAGRDFDCCSGRSAMSRPWSVRGQR